MGQNTGKNTGQNAVKSTGQNTGQIWLKVPVKKPVKRCSRCTDKLTGVVVFISRFISQTCTLPLGAYSVADAYCTVLRRIGSSNIGMHRHGENNHCRIDSLFESLACQKLNTHLLIKDIHFHVS